MTTAAERRRFPYERLLIRPCGLAGARLEAGIAAVFIFALIGVVVAEVVTPHDVLVALGFLPLVAAMWVLSGRLAVVVGLIGIALFCVILATETGNRPTVIYIGASGLLLAVATRLHSTRLAKLLSARRHHRSLVPLMLAWPGLTADNSPHGIESLTRRELEVARLGSQGYTALEIADRLYISSRTVESHLANAYTKLGIHSKPALIRMSARLSGH